MRKHQLVSVDRSVTSRAAGLPTGGRSRRATVAHIVSQMLLVHNAIVGAATYGHTVRTQTNPLMPRMRRTSVTKRRLSSTGMLCRSASSFGSDVQPSIGRALAASQLRVSHCSSTAAEAAAPSE